MGSEIYGENFEEALNKSVKEELRGQVWPIYNHYEVSEEDGETFVIAPLSPRWVPEHETSEWRGYSSLEVGNPAADVERFYEPLKTPELVVDLAYRAEKEITAEVVLHWAKYYGLLGLPEDNVVTARMDVGNFSYRGMGRRDRLASFVQAAREIRVCLRTYEEVTAGERPLDLEALDAALEPWPSPALKVLRPWERRAGEERRWVLRVVGRMIQARISEHCYPKLSHYPDGRFALSYGFKNLFGAIWLQMAWLLSAEDGVKRCKLLDCFRVITFESGEQPPAGVSKGKRGKYKTREDIEFCKDRPCKQKYHYRKTAGWPRYV